MRYIFPILTSVICIGLLQSLAGVQCSLAAQQGDVLVAAAVQKLLEQPSLEAKIRQRATLFGQRLTGAGYYLQLRDGERTLLRYEFKLQLADQSHSLLHVNDGTSLWLRRDTAQQYVNVRRLREAKRKASGRSDVSLELPALDLALGGLSQVLDSLVENFQFDVPLPAELKGVPTWELTGTWRPVRWSLLLPGQTAAIRAGQPPDWGSLAEHLPDAVQLTLGRDENFPLFPYRIEFRRTRRRPGIARVTPSDEFVVEPLVIMELFEVRQRPDLTQADFAFQPSDEHVEDLTEVYLNRLGLAETAQ